MIVDYDDKYNSDIEELLYELQEYMMNIDKDDFNYSSSKYKKEYFDKIMFCCCLMIN